MSDMEKLLIGATIATLAGLIVWLIQVGFNDLKKRLDEISTKVVTRDVCAERHRTVNEKLVAHEKSIRQLYDITRGEPTREEGD
jgi:DNA-binding HxlR family transcriptional regulator